MFATDRLKLFFNRETTNSTSDFIYMLCRCSRLILTPHRPGVHHKSFLQPPHLQLAPLSLSHSQRPLKNPRLSFPLICPVSHFTLPVFLSFLI